MNENICAISTSLGVGAISIVRTSGPDVISIVSKIFKESDLTKAKTHTIHYGHIVDEEEIIDEVLVMLMRAPKTFTTEELEQEYDYYMAQKLLEKMLGTGLISVAEFNKITAKNRQTFSPFLSEIMPKMT